MAPFHQTVSRRKQACNVLEMEKVCWIERAGAKRERFLSDVGPWGHTFVTAKGTTGNGAEEITTYSNL